MRLSIMQRQFPARPITSPKIERSMVEPTQEDNLDRPKQNRRAGRADPDRRRRVYPRCVAVPGRRPGRWVSRRPTGADDTVRSRGCPHFFGGSTRLARATHSGPRGVSRRDGAKPGREPEPGRQVAAGAGGRRAKRRRAPESPRRCRFTSSLHGDAPIQCSAARFRDRRLFQPWGHRAPAGWRVRYRECTSAAHRCGAPRGTCASANLTDFGKGNSVPLSKKHQCVFVSSLRSVGKLRC